MTSRRLIPAALVPAAFVPALVLAALLLITLPASSFAIGSGQCCATVLGACLSSCQQDSCTGNGDCTLVLNTSSASSETPGIEAVFASLKTGDRQRLKRVVDNNDRKAKAQGKTKQPTTVDPAKRKASGLQRPVKPTGPVKLDEGRIPSKTRRDYKDFWNGLSKQDASQLEAKLIQLETRAQRGENVQRELASMKGQIEYTWIVEEGEKLTTQKWFVAGGGNQQATCEGIGWIGRNGRLRCIGKLTTG